MRIIFDALTDKAFLKRASLVGKWIMVLSLVFPIISIFIGIIIHFCGFIPIESIPMNGQNVWTILLFLIGFAMCMASERLAQVHDRKPYSRFKPPMDESIKNEFWFLFWFFGGIIVLAMVIHGIFKILLFLFDT